jgi:hypothetical protein
MVEQGDSANVRVLIPDAYKYAIRKMYGESASELQKYVKELHRSYNK